VSLDNAELPSQLSRAIDAATEFVFITSASSMSAGGPSITYANAAFLNEMGYALADVLGKSPSLLYGPATGRAEAEILSAAIESGTGSTQGVELMIYRRNGSAFWAEFNARPVHDDAGGFNGSISVGRNITERRRDDDRLEMLSNAVDSTSDQIAIYAVDPNEKRAPRVVFVNEAMIEQSGFSAAEILVGGTGVGAETDKATLKRLRGARASGREIRERVRLYRKDGTRYWCEIAARPIRDASEKVTHWISVERNIDDIVQQEQALAELSRMQHDLIAMLAHDMKSPLTIIAGYAELLRESLPPRKDVTEALDVIGNTVARLVRLADDTLGLVKMEHHEFQLQPAPFDLFELIRKTVGERQGQRTFEIDIPKNEPAPILADYERLQQVFDNLVSNAIKYSSSDTAVNVRAFKSGIFYHVIVADSGIGIPTSEVERVFQRFERASNAIAKTSGIGFGLYLVKTIVELHGGTVQLQSREGKGTTVTVRLPVGAMPPEKP
jgi:PAS domain S-box-containing protein